MIHANEIQSRICCVKWEISDVMKSPWGGQRMCRVSNPSTRSIITLAVNFFLNIDRWMFQFLRSMYGILINWTETGNVVTSFACRTRWVWSPKSRENSLLGSFLKLDQKKQVSFNSTPVLCDSIIGQFLLCLPQSSVGEYHPASGLWSSIQYLIGQCVIQKSH